MTGDSGAAAVVHYWHAVEMFSPQSIPKIDPSEGVTGAQDRQGRQPWMPGHDATKGRLGNGQTWRHQVFCGLYDVETVSDVLADLVDASRDTSERRSYDKGAVASFFVTAEGLAVPGSLTVSTCAWAVGRATMSRRRDSTWLSGFDEARKAIEDAFIELTGAVPPPPAQEPEQAPTADESGTRRPTPDPLAPRTTEQQTPTTPPSEGTDPQPDQPRVLTPELMEDVVSLLANRLDVSKSLAPQSYRVRTSAVKEGNDPDADFLNSFYLDDLIRVRDAVGGSAGVGAALRSYLHPPTPAVLTSRVDVRIELAEVASRLSPDTVPAGRWPAAPGQSLAASQQFAVSTALQELAGRDGIFAVNGPPGTGKTTMLRDLIAAVVTERAARLAALDQPSDAFISKRHKYTSTEGYGRSVTVLRPELVGHEIVVASSNNAAVENVSREIPAAETVNDWPSPTAYFRELAQLFLDAQARGSKNARPVQAWGLLAAPLGKSLNRRALRGTLLNGNRYDKAWDTNPVPGLRQRLSDYEAGAERPSWAAAKEKFSNASRQVETLRSMRRNHASALAQLEQSSRQAAQVNRQLTDARSASAAAASARTVAQARLDEAHAALAPLEAALQDRKSLRPGLWSNVTSFGRRAARWQEEARPLVDTTERARREVAAAEQAASRAIQQLEAAESAQRTLEDTYATSTADVVRLGTEVASMHPSLDVHDPAGWEQRSDRERELEAPWLDKEFNEARTNLFLAALDLHEAWIANAGSRFRQNVLAATDVLGGSVPRGNADAVRTGWQSLFLVVPVISTTFASVDRMFTGLGREELGWLVVDEAGQATPQAPVGALWRTKRAVVVGDPLQLEPVFSLKEPGQELLRSRYSVNERWMQSRSSLQTLADQLCRYGTNLPSGNSGDLRWVGAPLRVHRRCIDPMFTIANNLAYGGDLMIPAAVEKPGPDLTDSCWFDVGGTAEGHWRPDQGELTVTILRELVEKATVPATDVRVISPFRTVANRLREEIQKHSRLKGVRVGTVHTTQGQEAPVVLLVLGGNRQSPGAKKFAIDKPNLLNSTSP